MTQAQNSEKYTCERVLEVKPWLSPGLVSVKLTRHPGFEFVAGQFARIGLPSTPELDAPDLWRAYSMVSHPSDDYLEFLSVTVPDGQFSPKLSQLRANDPLWVEKAPFGFLTLERFTAAHTLWLVCTGTGLSAYLPMLRDPDTWTQFKKVVLVHGVRTEDELAYRDWLQSLAQTNEQFIYLPVTSRQPWPGNNLPASRITTAYKNQQLQQAVGEPFEPESARVMLCGNPEMVTEMRALLAEVGFAAGRRGNPGTLAVENYW